MSTPAAPARPDTREMVIVHRVFRREFGNLPALVRAVPPGDTERAAVVLDWLRDLGAALHHHHSGEDEMMWPVLLERAATDTALILRMEEQHERIAELLHRAQHHATAFAAGAAPADGEALATTLTALSAVLDEHLDEEERLVLPVVERVMTTEEWDAMGERGRAGIPKDKLLVQLGFILMGTTPAERTAFMSRMPVAARVAWRLMGRRAWAKEYRRLYGTPPAAGA